MAGANLYSLIKTCKANSIQPYAYLVELFRQLPQAKTVEDFEALLPWQLVEPKTTYTATALFKKSIAWFKGSIR